jgi:outer membrane receptor protein involved in Fe transport
VGNGYKAGGFDEDNTRGNLDGAEYEDEEVISYEVGSKMDLLDGRARLNSAIFLSNFDNVQVSTFDGNSGFLVGNAAKTEVYGMELDGQYLITEELTFSGAVAYLDATYDSFPDAACNEPQVLDWVASGGTRASCVQDLSGKSLQFSPEWSANLSLDYAVFVGDNMELKLGADAMYSDEYEVANDLDPVLKQDSFWKIDARIQLLSANDTWSIAVLGKNLTDEKTTFWGNDVPLATQGFSETYFQMIDAPRSYELQLSYRF